MPKFTLPIEKIDLEDRDLIGKNFVNFYYLRNCSNARFPNSFFVTNLGFQETLSAHWKDLESLLSTNSSSLEVIEKTKEILKNKLKLNSELKSEISHRIKSFKKPLVVSANLSYPNQGQEKQIFTAAIENEKGLFEAVIGAYLAFLQPETVKQFSDLKRMKEVNIVLMISEKISPEVSGKAFVNFLDKDKIRIYSLWGEYDKNFTKDISVINKADLTEASYFIAQQKEQIAFIKGSYRSLAVSENFQNQRKLDLEKAREIASVWKKIETQTLVGVSIMYAVFRNKLFITEIEINSNTTKLFQEALGSVISLPLISTLKPIFPGIATGVSKFIVKKSDFKGLRHGEIAIVNSVEKESLPFLKKAGGIIINSPQNLKGSQEALVKKLGISAVVGKFSSLSNSVMTLDSRSGKVYQGAFSSTKPVHLETVGKNEEPKILKTATKIFATFPYSNSRINLDLNEADGVGPLNFENFSIKTRQEAFNFLTQVCQKANGKIVIIKLSKNHPNPNEHIIAQAELIKEIRNKASFKNLSVCLPWQKTASDLIATKKLLSSVGLHRSPTFKIFLEIGVAANIFSLKGLMEVGIDGIEIDYWLLVNNLYQENFTYSELKTFDDSAIDSSLETITETAKKHGQFTLVHNFPIEKSTTLSSKLVSLSVKALSTSWQTVAPLRTEVAIAEKDLIKNKK